MDLAQVHGAAEVFQSQCHIYRHMYYFIESMSLKCAAHLGIPDIIHRHSRPIRLSELASALNIPPTKENCLRRLMRILVHSGFFSTTRFNHDQEEEEEDDEECYILTNSSRSLLKDSSPSLSPSVMAMLDPAMVDPLFSLGHWFQGNDVTPFEANHGSCFGEYGKQNWELMNSLNEAMASDSRFSSSAIREHKEIFDRVASLVDVGAGRGTLTRTIAEAYPHIQCTVLDLPQVVENLPETKNLKFVGGDMFQSIPSADAIVIKSVLHNWDNESCIKILKRCREAIPSKDGGKLIIIEMVTHDIKDEHELGKTSLFVDMEMMLLCTGRERTEKAWEGLFLEAGFNHYKITAMAGLNSIIEVYP